ncbi:O-antigen ligase family protein [Chryseobacterium chendengshani]|uniref:O-antigen ligase family protein n=1 Tax=Chryseobacterium sp. LJ756 TaxID=2864113 RepID=UPI001C643BC2|nr:O-antigen ligase family protein [Chryseobacterium sp. LJ756]MBW7676616.1 O-antigen ligase family protein [Chryseobacterium sp. LJ756]
MKFSKFISFCSSLNLILTIAGYSFITTFLLPFNAAAEGMSQLITIPYRILVLSLSLVIIFTLFKERIKTNYWIKFLLFFWILYIARIIFDLSFRFDDFFTSESKFLYYSFVFFISFVPFLSIVYSYKYIYFDKVLIYSVVLLVISMIASLFSDSMLEENSRLTGNIALNPISYGEVGAKAILLSGFLFYKYKSLFIKIILIGVIALGFFTLGRAASRGPLLGMFIAVFFYLIATQRNLVKSIITLLMCSLLVIIFQNYIIDFIGFLSPTLKARVEASIYENDSSSRDELFTAGINQFLDHPLFGNYFVLYPESGKGINTHNMVIDVLMSLGLIGGLFFIALLIKGIYSSYELIKEKSALNWVGSLFIFSIVSAMVGATFYMDSFFSVIMFLSFVASSKIKMN